MIDKIKKVTEEIKQAKESYRHMAEIVQPFKNVAMEEVDIVPVVQPIEDPALNADGVHND